MVGVLETGGGVVLAGEVAEVVGGCGQELLEGVTGLAEGAWGAGDGGGRCWERVDACGACAGEEGEGVGGEGGGWEGVGGEVVVDNGGVLLDL